MSTVRSKTSIKIDELINATIVSGEIVDGHLLLTTRGGEVSDAGLVVDPLASYPVGAIYMSVDPTDPATVLGAGVWAAWGSGRVPVGVDPAQSEFNTVEETGGAKTHTLTTAEMPAHKHATNDNGFNILLYVGAGGTVAVGAGTNTTGDAGIGLTGSTGGGGAHNNLQPYITCYMWKRTA